jgi:hypothetical protein
MTTHLVVDFGMHKGKRVVDLPSSYCDWLVMNVPEKPIFDWHIKAKFVLATLERIKTEEVMPKTDPKIAIDTPPVLEVNSKARYNRLRDELDQIHLIKSGNWRKRVKELYNAIEEEEDRMAEAMESNLSSLEWMNDVLRATGHPAEDNLSKARHALKTKVHINIFELEAGNYHMAFKDFDEFVNDMMKNRRFFKLGRAKANSQLRLFLRQIC